MELWLRLARPQVEIGSEILRGGCDSLSAAEFLQQIRNLHIDTCDLSQLLKSPHFSLAGLNINRVLLKFRKCLPCAMPSNGGTTEREDNQKSARNGDY